MEMAIFPMAMPRAMTRLLAIITHTGMPPAALRPCVRTVVKFLWNSPPNHNGVEPMSTSNVWVVATSAI